MAFVQGSHGGNQAYGLVVFLGLLDGGFKFRNGCDCIHDRYVLFHFFVWGEFVVVVGLVVGVGVVWVFLEAVGEFEQEVEEGEE